MLIWGLFVDYVTFILHKSIILFYCFLCISLFFGFPTRIINSFSVWEIFWEDTVVKKQHIFCIFLETLNLNFRLRVVFLFNKDSVIFFFGDLTREISLSLLFYMKILCLWRFIGVSWWLVFFATAIFRVDFWWGLVLKRHLNVLNYVFWWWYFFGDSLITLLLLTIQFPLIESIYCVVFSYQFNWKNYKLCNLFVSVLSIKISMRDSFAGVHKFKWKYKLKIVIFSFDSITLWLLKPITVYIDI